jgi:two-component system phosphate regulon sensor histidine kinase PhoR
MIYILTAIALLSILLLLWQRFRVRRILLRLSKMLEQAYDGTFQEQAYDEKQLSQIEAKMSRFLASSGFSRRQVLQQKQQVEQLVSDISHQTKTPVANILLYTQLLQEASGLSPEAAELAGQVRVQAEKLNFLLQDLIKTSRLENGVLQLTPQKNKVDGLLEAVARMYQTKAQAKNIRILQGAGQKGFTAVFDPKWTAEALGNLVDNAVKYTPEGGQIQISAAGYEMFCRIDIADTGAGISEEETAKIFERFYRSAQTAGQEGVGLGLYLAREIISGQGGYIKVTSVLGQGSIFSVFLPRGNGA